MTTVLHVKPSSVVIATFSTLFVTLAKGGLAEQRITAYVHDKLIFFEAAVPVTCTDSNAVVTLVNTLNLKHPVGTFQYDIRDGELNWTVYLAARDGKWPGDDNVGTVLTLAREMAGLLYRELVSIANALTTTEQ